MQNLITKATIPYPPVAIGPLNAPEGAHLFPRPTVIRDSMGRQMPSFYTHGYTLTTQPGVDDDFLHLLLRCLADLPQDRPSLWELQWLMVTKKGSAGWAIPEDDPNGVRAWCDKMFKEPPPVSVFLFLTFSFLSSSFVVLLLPLLWCIWWLTGRRTLRRDTGPRDRGTGVHGAGSRGGCVAAAPRAGERQGPSVDGPARECG